MFRITERRQQLRYPAITSDFRWIAVVIRGHRDCQAIRQKRIMAFLEGIGQTVARETIRESRSDERRDMFEIESLHVEC